MAQAPTETTADQPLDGPAGSDDAAAASFARLLTAENATPSPDDDESDTVRPAESDEAEPAEEEDAPEDADEAPEDESEEAPEPTYTVKVDGKALEGPASELVKGYQRYSDYTRKTTELATERKALAAEIQSYAKVREDYLSRLEPLAKALKEATPEPDWDRLKQDDPIGYATAYTDWHRSQQALQAVEAERARVQQEAEQHADADRQARMADQQKMLLEAVPDWKDAKKAKAEIGRIFEYAKSHGISQEDLDKIEDHRVMLFLRDAARYRELADKVKASPVPTGKSPKALTASAPTSSRKPMSDLTKQRLRLSQTGREDDAAPIFLQMLEREQKRR
jgi:hypothetical protein